jgi:hypothetical protein
VIVIVHDPSEPTVTFWYASAATSDRLLLADEKT